MVGRYKYGSQEPSTHTVTALPLLNCSNIFQSPPRRSQYSVFRWRQYLGGAGMLLYFIPTWLSTIGLSISTFNVFQWKALCSNATILLYLGQEIPRPDGKTLHYTKWKVFKSWTHLLLQPVNWIEPRLTTYMGNTNRKLQSIQKLKVQSQQMASTQIAPLSNNPKILNTIWFLQSYIQLWRAPAE